LISFVPPVATDESQRYLAKCEPARSQSAVVPAAHWELAIDFKKATLSTRLIGAPAWIYNDVVTTQQFWCVRIEGSETWQFHQPAQKTGGK